jgi:hypothetical protein
VIQQEQGHSADSLGSRSSETGSVQDGADSLVAAGKQEEVVVAAEEVLLGGR